MKLSNKTAQIEGKLTDTDISSEWVNDLQELLDFEKKIPFSKLHTHIDEANVDQEFRILNRITHTNKHLEKMVVYKETMYKKNRYEHLIAFKHSMPKLKEEEDFYINANYITHPLFKNAQKQFILGQGPTAGSSADFWKVVDEHNVCVIVMLCNLKTEGFSLEEKYFPKSNKEIEFDELRIRNIGAIKAEEDFVIYRKMRITNKKNETKKEMKHYNITKWDDMGVIQEESFGELLDFIKMIVALVDSSDEDEEGRKQPLLIHCKAGIGRSGVFLALVAIYDYLFMLYKKFGDFYKKEEKVLGLDGEEIGISVFGVVRRLREDRWGCVEKPRQYYFIYKFTKYMLENLENSTGRR